MLVSNMGLVFGVLSDTVEVLIAVAMMLGGIYITYLIQKWADKTGEAQPSAANIGRGGGEQYQQNTFRN